MAAHFGDPAGELRALRTGVALAAPGHVGMTRVEGKNAWDLVDRVLPGDLFLREGQARLALLLGDGGRVAADAVVVRDRSFLLLTEGLTPAAVRDLLAGEIRAGEEVVVREEEAAILEITGPYAWELLARVDDPAVVGQPYLTVGALRDGTRCLRAGHTGEYAWDLLISRDRPGPMREQLLDAGAAFGIREVGVETLDHARLENWIFSPHAEGRAGLDPFELQLQARISVRKASRWTPVLRDLRSAGPRRRITAVRGPPELAAGARVALEGQDRGEILVAAPDPLAGGTIGIALLEIEVAESGLWLEADGHEIRTVSPPFVVNRSLLVRPERDAFADRDRLPRPPGTW